MLKRDQGTYGAMIFEEAQFNPGQPPLLVKDKRLTIWSEGCGYMHMDFDFLFKSMQNKYKEYSSEHMVGVADVTVTSYLKFLVPCMRMDATPLIVKSWQKIKN